MTAYTTEQIVAGIAQAMADYARSLPETSQDALFIYSHRQELARAALAMALELLQTPTDRTVRAGHSTPLYDFSTGGYNGTITVHDLLLDAVDGDVLAGLGFHPLDSIEAQLKIIELIWRAMIQARREELG